MMARPEPTHSEYLSVASFLGMLLVLPANVRLDWKVIARYKHSSLLGLVFCNDEKSFITLTQVNDISFENMSNDEAVRVLKEVVQKPG